MCARLPEKPAARQLTSVDDQLVELFQRIAQTQAFLRPGGIDHLGHLHDPGSIRQWQILFEDLLHAHEEDPLQPLMEVQGVDRKGLDTAERLGAGGHFVPPALHAQFALNQQ